MVHISCASPDQREREKCDDKAWNRRKQAEQSAHLRGKLQAELFAAYGDARQCAAL